MTTLRNWYQNNINLIKGSHKLSYFLYSFLSEGNNRKTDKDILIQISDVE